MLSLHTPCYSNPAKTIGIRTLKALVERESKKLHQMKFELLQEFIEGEEKIKELEQVFIDNPSRREHFQVHKDFYGNFLESTYTINKRIENETKSNLKRIDQLRRINRILK